MKLILFCLLFLPGILISQSVDTLTFYSESFGQERSIYVHKPSFNKYLSDKVKVPIIYVLDGQHEWFAKPVLNNLEFLKYTHEVPHALVVIIPHKNRNIECGINSLDGPALPLHTFITEEVEAAIADYNPGSYRMIIGHSFSASFSLYSQLKSEGFYSAVLAHSPLDELEHLVTALEGDPTINPSTIAISTGSIDADKDKYHREVYDEVKAKHIDFFDSICTYEANEATHNAVPIVANPYFLSKLFYPFSRRFGSIAIVDMEYKLVETPSTVTEEMQKIGDASRIGMAFYPAEIDEINGMASRYWNSGYEDHTIALYKEGIKNYPKYYDFHIQLYSLYSEKNPDKAKSHLKKALALVEEIERDQPEYPELLHEINSELKSKGWQ